MALRSRLVNPAPGGTEGRTDQGVDWSNIQGNIVAVAGGTIAKIYGNLQGFGTTVIERLKSGQYVYYAGETGAGAPVVSEGQQVTQGQAIAPGLGSGGIEVGYWDPNTGRSAGAPGYTEGASTAAGARFRNAIGPSGVGAGVASAGQGQKSTLAQLWIEAGGNPKLANLMSAIAMAESQGQVGAVNKQSGAAGLWQILPSAHPQYDVNRLTSDPLYNAQAAVAIEKSQGLGAWSTYTSGAYKEYLGYSFNVKTSGYGGTRPGGQPAGQSQSVMPAMLDSYVALRDMPRTAPPGTKNPFQWFAASFSGNWGNMTNAS